MKKLLTLIAISLIVSASVESKQDAKFNYCYFDGNGTRYCCTPYGFCYPAPKPPPADPIIIEPVN